MGATKMICLYCSVLADPASANGFDVSLVSAKLADKAEISWSGMQTILSSFDLPDDPGNIIQSIVENLDKTPRADSPKRHFVFDVFRRAINHANGVHARNKQKQVILYPSRIRHCEAVLASLRGLKLSQIWLG
jgi:hypothetical protein